MATNYILYEFSTGYSLFKVRLQADTVEGQLKEVQEGVTQLDKLVTMIEIVGVIPFQGSKTPGDECLELLRTKLNLSTDGRDTKHRLMINIAHTTLASNIQACLPNCKCETSDTDEVARELMRGIQLHASIFLKRLEEVRFSGIYTLETLMGSKHARPRVRVKIKPDVHKTDSHVIRALVSLKALEISVTRWGIQFFVLIFG